MEFIAIAKNLRFSPYKMRMLADVVRGKDVQQALYWLATCRMKRALPIKKVIESAAANAKDRSNLNLQELLIKEIKVDQGPMFKYFKPGAMGRANVQRKRLSHISVKVASK